MQRGGRELELARLVDDLPGEVPRLFLDSVQLVDEVHVPRRAAELTVRHRAQPDLLLLAHGVTNRLVLERAQLAGGELRGAGVEDAVRPQQTADMVGAERRPVALRHGYTASGCWPSGSDRKISSVTPRSVCVGRYANETPL